MSDNLPPLYPFPNDTILWGHSPEDFDPDADSYITLAKLPEDDVRVFNGKEHDNPYRLVIRTPIRGSTSLFVNAGDLVGLLAISLAGLADDDSGMYGPTDERSVDFYAGYWAAMSGVGVNIVGDGDE